MELHAKVGLVASAWSMFEFTVNRCIWMLAGLNPVAGACITAQIVNMASRIDCLLALMKLRSIDEKFLMQANKLKQTTYGTQEKRNRLIHDPFVYHSKTRMAGQIEITAKGGKPVFRVKEISMDEVVNTHKEILRRIEDFSAIEHGIVSALDTLPDIPQPAADPMAVQMVLKTLKISPVTKHLICTGPIITSSRPQVSPCRNANRRQRRIFLPKSVRAHRRAATRHAVTAATAALRSDGSSSRSAGRKAPQRKSPQSSGLSCGPYCQEGASLDSLALEAVTALARALHRQGVLKMDDYLRSLSHAAISAITLGRKSAQKNFCNTS